MTSDQSSDVVVGVCGPDGLCGLCAGEDRTGTDGCGSYFQAADNQATAVDTTPTEKEQAAS